MKIVLLISALLTVVSAQEPASLSCNYFFSFDTYRCELTIYNPNGLDDFTEIGGIHLEGFSNADVTYIYRTTGFSSNVPSIICDSFPNVRRVMFYNSGLTEITDSTFAECTQIVELDLVLNRISSISPNALANLPDLEYFYLENNNLRVLPENLFANQQSLLFLDLSYNPLEDVPTNLFQPLENLQTLYLGYANLDAVDNQWFTSNPLLDYLYLAGNRIVLEANSFVGLERLTYLNLAHNFLNVIPPGTFASLTSLHYLYVYGNNFTELVADSFPNLGQLVYLDISDNPTVTIHDGAFRGLTSVTSLSLSNCRIRVLNSNSFEGLDDLGTLILNFNQIEELPAGVFVPLQSLTYIGLWNNRLKTLRRSSFGDIANLQTVDLEGNIVNAIDREFIDDAVGLNTLYFNGNLCASNYFGSFLVSRNEYLPMLQRCFDNMRFIVDITTEADGQYSFFEGLPPGIVLRVNANNEVQISLTPFNFEWSPMVEIFLGTTNNTRSAIRINQETNVVTVPTPNVIISDQWNDFRITWVNQVVLVYSGNSSFPFMGYTMRDFFPVNFYGLRAVETTASWSVQPLDAQ